MAKKTQNKVEKITEAKKYFLALDALTTIHFNYTDNEYVYKKIPADMRSLLDYWSPVITDYVRRRTDAYYGSSPMAMKPDVRFAACCEAVANKKLLDSLADDFDDDEDFIHPDVAMTSLVVAIFQNDEALFLERKKFAEKVAGAERSLVSFIHKCFFDLKWFRERRPAIRDSLLRYMSHDFLWSFSLHPVLDYCFREGGISTAKTPLPASHEAMIRFWRGEVEKAKELCSRPCQDISEETERRMSLACIRLFMGEPEALTEARELYAFYRKSKHMRLPLNTGCTIGLVCALSCLVYGSDDDLAEMRASIARTLKTNNKPEDFFHKGISGMYAIQALDLLRKGDESGAEKCLDDGDKPMLKDENLLSMLLYVSACVRMEYFTPYSKDNLTSLVKALLTNVKNYPFLERAFKDVMEQLAPEKEKEKWQRGGDVPASFLNCTQIVKKMEQWMMRLLAMEELARETQTVDRRMLWVLDPKTDSVSPRMQQLGARGWNKPRSVSLKRLFANDPALDFMTPQDRTAAAQVVRDNSWYENYELSLSDCCQALEGHPLLYINRDFDENSKELVPVKLQKGQLELVLGEGKKGTFSINLPKMLNKYTLSTSVYYQYKDGVLTYYSLSDREVRLTQLVSDKGLTVPKAELPRVLALTKSELNVGLRADSLKAEEVDPVSTPVVQMEQTAAGFAAHVGVRPFGRPGTIFFPIAEGAEEALAAMPLEEAREQEKDAEQDKEAEQGKEAAKPKAPVLSKTVRVRRDFAAEKAAFDALKAACPVLASNLEETRWESGDPEEMLNLLEELRNCGAPNIVEWPRGRKISLAGSIDVSKVKVKISRAARSDWFDVSGDVQLSEGRMLSLKGLLSMLRGSRFVALGDGEYVSLTDDLRRRLAKLKLVTAEGKKDNLQVSALAAGTVEQALEDMDLAVDQPWKHSIERMHKAFAADPKVPPMLKADLREYQREGYEWLQRLAIWGVGGCLADDMGLGKTVQAIAVMLNQAVNGPCLVVAPTSVCANWELEINRFAPNLSVHRLGMTDRQKVVDDLEANDVLIVGYGLLANVEKELCSRIWSMIVYDEAQAMKNAQTKRARAARKIEGDFRLALTGTPIENRIDDLWSLFNIINPGLLGSWESFSKRYGTAAPGTSSSRSLRAVVRPFLLRRLKSVVLDELPEKTEQNIIVEPNEKEIAFYESLRSNAVAKLAQARTDGGSNRIAILAELTKLRRACCHPGLADPDMMALEKQSSKTEQFIELVESLIASGHKVLAFSQFTSYLAMIRGALTAKNIRWQYLDGSTPEKERRERVAAFQKGEGDVFLLSLKAGGTGLNLTAADYVIHLDPWWNPAVEDQASDRAHRIGQKRPVTIYRMVQKGSVEEKILQLHGTKRELAADFLEGTESAVKTLTEEDLMNLMR